ncbi:GNAT family N-acetyltransferase [Nafulsella turpanensis]|uniref:GNAT family N-acetyltransferase n=1 Tax=Nafulsella turpanensis TaxID=1265690 RepID=UPI00034611A7|nr:GNAT family N-acetyltransferase [Nafulsella turpanensis]
MEIVYIIESQLKEEEFIEVLQQSGLAERRPIHQQERISKMCRNANLVVTARLEGKLIGLARSVTDGAFCTYLSDLAVNKEFQHRGIGKALIHKTQEAVPEATLILLAAPAAVDYYPEIGMQKHEAAFILKADKKLK